MKVCQMVGAAGTWESHLDNEPVAAASYIKACRKKSFVHSFK